MIWRGQFHWKKSLIILTVPLEMRGRACHTGPQEKHRVRKQKQEHVPGLGQSLHWGFWGKDKVGQVRCSGLASFLWGWSPVAWYLALGGLPSEAYFRPDRGALVLDCLVCISKASSWLSSLLSLRISWPWEGLSLPSQKGFSRYRNIIIYRERKWVV